MRPLTGLALAPLALSLATLTAGASFAQGRCDCERVYTPRVQGYYNAPQVYGWYGGPSYAYAAPTVPGGYFAAGPTVYGAYYYGGTQVYGAYYGGGTRVYGAYYDVPYNGPRVYGAYYTGPRVYGTTYVRPRRRW